MRKDRLDEIINKRVSFYYHNSLLLWFTVKLIDNNFNMNKINLADYYYELSPTINLQKNEFQLSQSKDLVENTDINKLRNWVEFTLKLPDNPLIYHKYPSFLNSTKFENLLSLMIPQNFVININKSYVNIIGNKSDLILGNTPPPTIVKLSINPVLILGGGINNTPTPQFLIDGNLKIFEIYEPDIAQSYLDERYPHCRKCLKWGTTSASCPDCKVKLNKKRNKLRSECEQKKMTTKQIRLLVGKVKLDS